MAYLFLLGRILFGGFFIIAGINHFQNLALLASFAGPKGVPAPKAAVAISGLLILVGGALIVCGIAPGVAVLCIVLFLIPVTLLMHAYWKDTDPMTQLSNRVNFQKNVALLGAALTLLAVPRPWPMSLF
jgi:uncharacterized membrane protein YphA (DoxX/SURF4 family)